MTAIRHRERRRTLPPRILSAALLLVALGTGSVSALVWHTEIVDAIDDVGWYPSIAMDGGGNPGIAYHDWSNADLKYAAWTGARWQVGTVDTVGRVGEHTSLALGTTGPPRISYYDETNADLKYAVYIGPPWSWRLRTVDSMGDVGKYSSLALDGAGSPRISYYDATNADLKYAAWTGAAWEIETVDSAGIVGQYSSLVLDAAGNPRISYNDETNASLKYAAWTGSAWQTETVDPIEEHGQSSLALDGAGDPHISYYAGINYYGITTLKYATRSDGGWRIEVVDAQGQVGFSPSLALDGAGNPGISYFDNTNRDLKYAWADAPPAPVPPSTRFPTDTDGDEIYDDVNGNGRPDFADVVLYFNQMAWIAANEPVSAFDCNRNGRIDFADVVWLFNNIDGSPDRSYTVTAIGIGPGVIMPSGNVTVPEGGNITFYLESRGVLPTPYATQNGYVVGNYVLVDPTVAPTPHPIEYEGPFGVTPSYTLHDVRSDHTIYGCFYYVHIWA